MRYAVVFGIIGSMMLSACSDTPPKLRDLYDPYAGPEEFAISPNLELEMPQDLASLPTPTPGGKNLTDPNPKGDAIALLGGDPNRVTASRSDTNDGALWTYATRFGFDPNIRETVSEEDRRFRLFQGRFSQIKLFRVDRYNQIYRRQTLDAKKEVQRWRERGVSTPSMPSN